MNRIVHETALRAAAKLAFSVGVVSACGQVAQEAPRDGADLASDEAPETDRAAETVREPKVDAAAEQPLVDASVDAVADVQAAPDATLDVESCLTRVQDALDADAAIRADADVLACCSLLAQKNDERWQNSEADLWTAEQRSHCCSALDWNGSMSCTPWGPPAPPRFDDQVVA